MERGRPAGSDRRGSGLKRMKVSAYVPFFNNAGTLQGTVESVLAQGILREDMCVIDDGSTDDSLKVARRLGVEVRVNDGNRGRGFTRARATREARHDLILSCDAGKGFAPDFLTVALPWMEDPRVAVVFGRVARRDRGNWVERWESRHIYKEGRVGQVNRKADLNTGGFLARRSILLSVGNFDERLRHSEDAELGARLLSGGFDVVYDPALSISPLGRTKLLTLLERYWRWHTGPDEKLDFMGYLRTVVYSVKVLAKADCAARDFAGVPISLFVPHYQFWRNVWRRLGQRRR